MSRAPRVAIMVDSLRGGGAERVMLLLAQHWPGDVKPLLIVGTRSGPLVESIPEGLEVVELSKHWGKNRLRAAADEIRGLRRMHAEGRFDILLACLTSAHIALAGKKAGLLRFPIVVSEHNNLSSAIGAKHRTRLGRRAHRAVLSALYRQADGVTAVSRGVAKDLEKTLGLASGSVTAIHNPVDKERIRSGVETPPESSLVESFENLPRPVVVTVGRLVEQKAHDDLIHAFAASNAGSLVILGEGPLRDDLTALAKSLGVEDRVWMPGFVDNPWWFMANSDLFCLSSRREGHPLVLLEALACGVPAVSTDCPSGPAEILEGVYGCELVPVGDRAGLSSAIDRVLQASADAENAARSSLRTPKEAALDYKDLITAVLLPASEGHAGKEGRDRAGTQ